MLFVPGFQALCRRLTRDHVRVLMYHRFAPGAGDAQRLGAQHFGRQLAYIARHHRVWSVDQHLDSYAGSQKVIGSPVVLTVDDGYQDFNEIALPLLTRHDVAAALFVVTGFISGEFWFWWDKLRYMLEITPQKTCDIELHGKSYRYSLANDSERRAAWSDIATDLSQLSPEIIIADIERIAALLDVRLPSDAPQDYAAVSWEQLADMAGSNIILGAHTCTHPALSRLNADQAAAEIKASREAIKARTGDCSKVFCYPHGQTEDYTVETKAIVEQLGFSGAYVAFESDGQDLGPYEMQRYSVHDDWVDFRWKLCGAQLLLQR